MIDSILLTLQLPHHISSDIKEEIEEMKLLANTLSYEIVYSDTQNKIKIDPSTYFGKGKIQQIKNKVELLKIDTIFINDEIKPNHFKNIKKILGDKINIIDRTCLILNIFKSNAKSNESKLQVKLATLEYMMPRLTGMWTHLERQMGGVGTRGGPGEKQIEIDRRLIRKDIVKLKKDLNKIDIQRKTQNKSRKNIFKVCLVGYTNAGKSSLLNKIVGYDTYVENKLFATLDTTTKRYLLPSKREIVISDTVGFLRKLPHNLVASFRSTLSDISDADLILKIVDASASDLDGHIDTINNTLKNLDAHTKKYLYVFNKIDKINDEKKFNIINNKYNNPLMISTLKDLRIDILINLIDEIVKSDYVEHKIIIPYNKTYFLDQIYKQTLVIDRIDEYEYIVLKILCTKNNYKILKEKLKK